MSVIPIPVVAVMFRCLTMSYKPTWFQ